MRFLPLVLLIVPLCVLSFPAATFGQKKKGADLKAPEPGYVFPAGGKAGTTVNVHLGGFDWTPDVQFFSLDPRVKLETHGTMSPIFVPPPPYWFGAKSTTAPLPLLRETAATITLPADLPAGPVRWAVASASGAGLKTGVFWVGTETEVVEDAGKGPQKLAALPVTVSGRLSRNEEVDRYTFTATKDGPITCEVAARKLGVNLNAALAVRDAAGQVVADAVDTEGQDVAITFSATAGARYTIDVNDLDFRGDRSFVYRLTLTPGPRVVATIPAAGPRGKTLPVEFVGYGLATGRPQIESVTKAVEFPTDPRRASLAYRLETPFGTAPPFEIPLASLPETAAAAGPELKLSFPAAVTGVLDPATGKARFLCDGKKGDVWDLAAEARRFGSPLDLSLAVLDAGGKELLRSDDLPGTTDAGFAFTVPADGAYTLEVSDQSGRAGPRSAVYRLTAEKPAPDFTLATAARLNLTLGRTAELLVTAKRKGGHKEPITLKVDGLPEGVSVPAGLVIPADKTDLKIVFKSEENAPSLAALFSITGSTPDGTTRPAFAPLTTNLAARWPDGERTDRLLLASTLKSRIKLVAVEADGGRKVHRGTTFPAEVTIERTEDFQGEVSLQMSAAQSYQRQGITGPDLVVPAGTDRAFYPCFMPEWLETTRTSRMELIGVVKIPDARGNMRYLASPMAGRITMSIEGSLLKVGHAARELTIRPGGAVAVPVTVMRSSKLTEAVKLELVVPEELKGALQAEPVVVAANSNAVDFRVTCSAAHKSPGEFLVTVRGTALQGGKLAVVSETTVPLGIAAAK